PEDLADMFCRVEGIPYGVVRELLERSKTWDSLPAYLDHLEQQPLGPHLSSLAGHSAIRAHVMGMARSLERSVVPASGELERMERILEEALDAGYFGVSIQTLPWDKMGGSRPFRSRPLPSAFARWSEYRRLTRIVRRRDRIFQGVPNITTKVNVVNFLLESAGIGRKPLKTTIISMMDVRANRGLYKLSQFLSRVVNRLFNGDFRWQALPEIFDLWADGIDLVVFEEFGAGVAALHLQEAAARQELFADPAYRRWFRRQWRSKLLPKVFHRDFNQSRILRCPDGELVGKSFAQVALEAGRDVVDVFLDLVARFGTALRWYTVMANDRREVLEDIVRHPDVLIGFSDAGAHLRNMAHYNFPLRMLRLVREAERRGAPLMTPERAVHRLTGEIAGWFGMDAGTLAVGKRADLVVLDVDRLAADLDHPEEKPMERFGDFVRLVSPGSGAVQTVLISGKPAVWEGAISPALGRERGFGTVLRAR
ncbi:MAG TPA: amidohydrolase family protein, partial [Myxococcaceae bacterium]